MIQLLLLSVGLRQLLPQSSRRWLSSSVSQRRTHATSRLVDAACADVSSALLRRRAPHHHPHQCMVVVRSGICVFPQSHFFGCMFLETPGRVLMRLSNTPPPPICNVFGSTITVVHHGGCLTTNGRSWRAEVGTSCFHPPEAGAPTFA